MPPAEAAIAARVTNTPEFTVSELAQSLRRTVEDAYGQVRVRGELSGIKRPASGHVYGCLKDERSALDLCLWKATAAKLAFRPEDGLEVIATGKLSTNGERSKYQLIVDRLEPAGVGALLAQLERLKARLAAEGLFAAERKRPLPFLPRRIGVVTSPTGAVIRDILHRLADRFPRPVMVWPVMVQGDAAAGQVAAAVRGFNAMPAETRPDLIIVARGGGSIEDLWPFNAEEVARAVAGSAIPVMSAVGHETDHTLIDLAADRRAPTPTAAAEIAVPVRADLVAQVADLAARAERSAGRYGERARERTEAAARRLPGPRELMGLAAQRLDHLAPKLPAALDRAAERGRHRLGLAALAPAMLSRRAERAGRDLASARAALSHAGAARVGRARQAAGRAGDPLRPALAVAAGRSAAARLATAARLLETLSFAATLGRGYAVVERPGGGVVASAAAAAGAREVRLRFHDGKVTATVRATAAPRGRTVQETLL